MWCVHADTEHIFAMRPNILMITIIATWVLLLSGYSEFLPHFPYKTNHNF